MIKTNTTISIKIIKAPLHDDSRRGFIAAGIIKYRSFEGSLGTISKNWYLFNFLVFEGDVTLFMVGLLIFAISTQLIQCN